MGEYLNQFPLYFLPPVGFISKFLSTQKPELLIGEKFEKQTYRSRFEIAGPNGRQLLSIPLIHKSTHAFMAEVQVDYSHNWNVKHWRSIETAYRRAPFFEFYAHYFMPLFTKKYFLLAELNLEALKIIFKILKSEPEIKIQTDFTKTLNLEIVFNPKPYFQVFEEKNGFLHNLSILDLVFNQGPSVMDYMD
ncbi:MAG: WbqC family protein [Bacteroidia bacterium]